MPSSSLRRPAGKTTPRSGIASVKLGQFQVWNRAAMIRRLAASAKRCLSRWRVLSGPTSRYVNYQMPQYRSWPENGMPKEKLMRITVRLPYRMQEG